MIGRDAALWQWTALLHRALDDNEAAIAAFQQVQRLNPSDAKAAHGHALAALDIGRPAQALFERAQRLAPNDGDVLLGIAHARHAAGNLAGAIVLLDALLAQHPGWLPGHHLAANLRWLSGDRDGFTVSLEQALTIAPREQALWHALILLLLQAQAHERVLDAVRRGRSALGPHLLFDANEAAAAAELGDAATADRLFAKIGEIDDIVFAVRHVRHLLRSGRIKQAAERAERWTGHPDANLIWPYLGLAWRMLGDPRWQWLEGDERLVGIVDIGGTLPSLAGLADCLRALHGDRQEQLDQSVRGGTQTRGVLFARAELDIRSLRAAIVEAVHAHIAQLPPPDPRHPLLGCPRPRAIRFSGSWSVRLGAQGHHANHIHPAGWLSSAFYAALPPEDARGPAPAGWLALGAPEAVLGLDLPPTRLIEPKPGRLVLFPSTMWHGTLPFDRGERLTVAFDVMPGLA